MGGVKVDEVEIRALPNPFFSISLFHPLISLKKKVFGDDTLGSFGVKPVVEGALLSGVVLQVVCHQVGSKDAVRILVVVVGRSVPDPGNLLKECCLNTIAVCVDQVATGMIIDRMEVTEGLAHIFAEKPLLVRIDLAEAIEPLQVRRSTDDLEEGLEVMGIIPVIFIQEAGVVSLGPLGHGCIDTMPFVSIFATGKGNFKYTALNMGRGHDLVQKGVGAFFVEGLVGMIDDDPVFNLKISSQTRLFIERMEKIPEIIVSKSGSDYTERKHR
jgi:hypothetical protein